MPALAQNLVKRIIDRDFAVTAQWGNGQRDTLFGSKPSSVCLPDHHQNNFLSKPTLAPNNEDRGFINVGPNARHPI